MDNVGQRHAIRRQYSSVPDKIKSANISNLLLNAVTPRPSINHESPQSSFLKYSALCYIYLCIIFVVQLQTLDHF